MVSGRKKKAPPPPPSLKTATSLANIATTSSSLEPITDKQNKSNTEPNTPVVASDAPVVERKPGKLNISKYYQTITPLPFKTPSVEQLQSADSKLNVNNGNGSKMSTFTLENHPLYSRKKLSIYVPPPPKLPIDRNESAESWNCFMTQLGKILDSRVGELV